MKASRFLWIVRIAVMMIVFATAVYYFPLLSDSTPIHWNIEGKADNYASKWFAVGFFPVLIAVMMIVFAYLPALDPRREKYREFTHAWELIQSALLVFFAYAYYLTLSTPLHPEVNIGTRISFGLGILFILLGNYLGKIRSNYFIGIRTPWTLSDEDNWNKTHRFGGHAFVVAGAIAILASWSTVAVFPIFLAAIIIAAILPVGYSYYLFRTSQSRQKI